MNSEPWYKNAVFYEVSVSAFKDGNGDGRGDLQGLSEKLDYITEPGRGLYLVNANLPFAMEG